MNFKIKVVEAERECISKDELAKLLIEQCKAELTTDLLNRNNREIEIDF